jgi:anti-sigma factor RsiW
MSLTPQHPLDAFADGELSTEQMAELAALLKDDADALAEVAAIRALGDRLRESPLPLPASGAEANWLRNWQIARDRSVRRLAGWMTAAASVILGITLSAALTRPAQAQPQLADWETAAVAGLDDEEAPRAARLIAVDLSLPHGGEGVQ